MKDIKIVIGANFGDEGKGKLTDYYTKNADNCIVVCSNGGAHGTAAPELQIMIEDLINQIESWYPGINRELLLKIASNNV